MLDYMNATESLSNSTLPLPPNRLSTLLGATIMAVFLILGVAGGFITVGILLWRRRLCDNVINLFILSLCINDLINMLLNQPLVLISYFAHGWVLGDVLCNLLPELNMVLVAVSLWHHALIAIHRYLVVVQSVFYRQMNKKRYAALVIVGTRLFPVTLSIVLAITLNDDAWNFGNMTIYTRRLLRCIYKPGQQIRILVIVVLTFLVPCLVVLVCFAAIFIFVHRAGRRSSAVLQTDRGLFNREIQITKMFGVVFILFLIGYIPYGFVRMGDRSRHVTAESYVVVTVLYACASCLNTIIFGAMNPEIRGAALDCICGRPPSQPGVRHKSSTMSKRSVNNCRAELLLQNNSSANQQQQLLLQPNSTQETSSVSQKNDQESDIWLHAIPAITINNKNGSVATDSSSFEHGASTIENGERHTNV